MSLVITPPSASLTHTKNMFLQSTSQALIKHLPKREKFKLIDMPLNYGQSSLFFSYKALKRIPIVSSYWLSTIVYSLVGLLSKD